MAAEPASSSCPLPDPHGPQAERLLNQPLSSQMAQQQISQLLDQPPFEHKESVTRWRFGEATEAPDEEDLKAWTELIEKLLKLTEGSAAASTLALIFEALLWATLLGLVAWLLWRYREWLATFAGRLQLPQRRPPMPPSQLFGLEVTPESLPDDIPAAVQRLWDEQPRAALGLLYRALLSHLLHQRRLALKSAHTEAEVLSLIEQLQQAELSHYSAELTRHWQNLAYGHRLPPPALKDQLCSQWRELFGREVQA